MTTARILLLLLSLSLTFAALAAESRHEKISPLIDTATAARVSGDYAAAEAGYRQALSTAQESGDKTWELRAWFYLGLTRQEAAEKPENQTRAKELRLEARTFYQNALKIKPSSSATLMNLQETQWAIDDAEGSLRTLEKGLALGDARAAEFATILGDRYARSDSAKAVEYYRIAVDSPGATAALRQLFVDKMSVYGAREELIGYIRQQLAVNEVDRAIDAAFQALEAALSPAAQWSELPVVLAEALAKKDYDAVVFAASESRRRLEPLLTASPQKELLRGIWNLCMFEIADGTAFEPWQSATARVTAFRALAASIASSEFRQGRFDRAELYYKAALNISADTVDPALLRELANTYATQKKIDAVDELVKEYEPRVHAQQQIAASEELEVYYEYHRMIASIYGSLGRRDPRRVTQLEELEHATQVSDAVVEPQMYEQLAVIYQRRGEPGDDVNARQAWLSRAEALRRDGNLEEARESLVMIPMPMLDAKDRVRYFSVVDQVVTLKEVARLQPEEVTTVKHSLLLLTTRRASRQQRGNGARQLRELGITANVGLGRILIAEPDGTRTAVEFELPARAMTLRPPMRID
jgi:tetratricopeptide (TPR) repeat protein